MMFTRAIFAPSFTSLALSAMLHRDGYAAPTTAWSPPDGKPHFAPKAKSVIWLFMNGGVSHLETFDPKPELDKLAGKTIGETPYKSVQDPEKLKLARVVVINDANGQQRNKLLPTQVGFKKYGKCGADVSDWLPHMGEVVDDLAIIRSMYTTDDNHAHRPVPHWPAHARRRASNFRPGMASARSTTTCLVRQPGMGARILNLKDGHYLGPAHDAVPGESIPRTRSTTASPKVPSPQPSSRSASN